MDAILRTILSLLLGWPLLAWANGEVELVTEELPWAVVDHEYLPAPLDVHVSGRCPAGGVGFSVVSGALPPGLKLSSLGYFSGVPTKTGLFEFNVRAVNGCSWSARHFTLLVTEAPKLTATPEEVAIEVGDAIVPPSVAIRLSATWPKLSYSVSVAYSESASDWLMVIPEQGSTSKESVPRKLAEVPGDNISLRFNVLGLKPGRYTARILVTAWQALPISVPVALTVLPESTGGH